MYLELELMESICSGMQRGGTNGVTIPGIQGRDNLAPSNVFMNGVRVQFLTKWNTLACG